jgi:uncharacterized protein YbbC (DUF1343 family)
MPRKLITLLVLLLWSFATFAQPLFDEDILPGAEATARYIPALKKKRVALVINQTSIVNGRSLLDVLLEKGVNVNKIFVPEHGFRGNEDAGAHIDNGIDSATGIPVISLYGNNKKPKKEQLADVDVLIYDLQDVGVRFYTYISTLEYCMEAAFENGKKVIVLDRPNPNGHYVDGPVLEMENRSFVGMQPIPIVYGMTAGEYAKMLLGEHWIKYSGRPYLDVIKCRNYTHSKMYRLPVAPSPNLRDMEAIYAYPSLCLFEGTPISLGRGTDKPFRQYGHPSFEGKFTYSFKPVSSKGAKKPPHENQTCYGEFVAKEVNQTRKEIDDHLQLKWLIEAYSAFAEKDKFFTPFFTKLAGTGTLQKQIENKIDERAIRSSWEIDLNKFKAIRSKYLLYPVK